MDEKSSSSNTRDAASRATSVPRPPIAMPMWAALSAGASFTPSPVIATTSPAAFSAVTIRSFCSGMVRATIDNSENLLTPEMLASVDLFTEAESSVVAVPREALVQDGPLVSVWVVREDRTIELRKIKTGAVNGTMVQVSEGLSVGDKIVVLGNLFLTVAS